MRHPVQKIIILIVTLFCGVVLGVNSANAQPGRWCTEEHPVATNPEHGAAGISRNTDIDMFNYFCSSAGNVTYTLVADPPIPGDTTSFSCGGDAEPRWRYTPSSNLSSGTLYTVHITLVDSVNSGNSFDCEFQFTTAGGGPPPPPQEPPDNVQLTVNVSPGGTGEVEGKVFGHAVANDPIDCPDDCSGSYPPGTSLRLTAEAAAGQIFKRWKTSGGVHVTKRDNPVEIRIDADGELTARFGPNNGNSPPKNCKVEIKNGTVTGGCEDPEKDIIDEVKLLIFPEQNRCKEGNPDFFSIIRETAGTISFSLNRLAIGKRFCAVICSTDRGSGKEGCSQETCFNTGQNGNVNTPPLPAGFSQKDYKLVSFPVNLANSRATDFIGLPADASPDRIRFLTWDTAAGRYRGYKDLRIVPGRGYWYLSSVPFDGKGTGVSTSAARNNDVSLLPGWNQIGSPIPGKFQFSEVLVLAYDNECRLTTANIRIGDLAPNNPFLEKRLLSWNGSGYSNTNTVEAYKGYWVKAKKRIILRFGGSGKTASADSTDAEAGGSCLINTLAK